MKVYKNLDEAKRGNAFYGWAIISLNEDDIANLAKNKVLSATINDDYKVFIEWDKDGSSVYPPWLYTGESSRNRIKELEKELAEKEQTIQELDKAVGKVFGQAIDYFYSEYKGGKDKNE